MISFKREELDEDLVCIFTSLFLKRPEPEPVAYSASEPS
jgi:hypothetical protein